MTHEFMSKRVAGLQRMTGVLLGVCCTLFVISHAQAEEGRALNCFADAHIPPPGDDRYPNFTATGTVLMVGETETEDVTFTGHIVNRREAPYCDEQGRSAFDWYTIERDLTATTSMGTITSVQDPEVEARRTGLETLPGVGGQVQCYNAVAVVDDAPGHDFAIDFGAGVIGVVPDGELLMQAVGTVDHIPPANALFTLVQSVDFVTEVSQELVFTLETLTINTGALARGGCNYGGGVCFVVPQYTCDNAGGSYLGDGTPCSDIPIPAVSEWGLIVVTLLAMTLGTIMLARRHEKRVARTG